MNLVGSLRLPCNHHRVNAPTEPGITLRRCDTCKKSYNLIVRPMSATLAEKLGSNDAYTARWEEV